ncbi:hypothetical protein HT574_09460 [Parageobacillus sp. VR-IP]|uniref:hypothetical protein n=1 Tax=Parageobacillus sp. VR-IP TaxID=2742205 RepID=UPI0015814656|nr:hypothetical protein [Parageobacillus sp. VR-IP]NUK30308.1 hypothetical protein [Parageobacillus sp. VR-IP]
MEINKRNCQYAIIDGIEIDTKSLYEAASPTQEKMVAAARQMVQLLKTLIAEKDEQLNAVK